MCKMKKFLQSLLAFFIVLVKEEKIKVLVLTIYQILLYYVFTNLFPLA